MKPAFLALALGLTLAFAPFAACAQGVVALPEDPGAAVVEELVVQAKEPGPAWWVVSDGDSTVYILGMPEGPLPKDLAWDRRWLDRRLAGANSLILADRMGLSVGVSSFGDAFRLYRSLRSDTPLETRLEEPLRSRFVAARRAVGRPASRYSNWTPFIASFFLWRDASPTGWVNPRDSILKSARREKITLVYAGDQDVTGLLKERISKIDPALETACLAAAVSTVERASPKLVAQGWATGDVASAISGPREYDGCLLQLTGGADVWRKSTSDQALLITKALETPGHSVALVHISRLVAEEGVVRRLEARGLTVKGPGGR